MSNSLDILKPKPLLILDGWRGIAVLWVVMFHAIFPFLNTPGKQIYIKNPLYWISSFGDIGVTLFFIISGYCITGALCNDLLKKNSFSSYIISRVKRIYPPYFIALVLYATASLLTIFLGRYFLKIKHLPEFSSDWFSWFSNLVLIQHELKQPSIVPVAWSLCYEIAFYAIFAFILALICASKKFSGSFEKCYLFLSLSVYFISLVSLICLIFYPSLCPFPFQLWYQFGIGSLFYLESLTFKIKKPALEFLVLNPRFQLFSFMILIFIYGFLHHSLYRFSGVTHGAIDGHAASPIQPFATVFFMLILFLMRPFDTLISESFLFQVLMRLGMISYSVYLIHILVQPFIDAGFRHLGLDNNWYFPNFILQIVIPIIFSIPFYILVEKRCLSPRRLKIVDEEKSFCFVK